nr:uncharacterized protein LOC128697469 isoform X2 [Cherax quadricarinatus]
MPDGEARVDPEVKYGSRESILSLEQEQKPLLSASEGASSGLSNTTADPDNMPQLASVAGVNAKTLMGNKEFSCVSQVPTINVCTVNGDLVCDESDSRQHLPFSPDSLDVSSNETSTQDIVGPQHTFYLPTEEETGGLSVDSEVAVVGTVPGACDFPTLHTQTSQEACPAGRQLQGGKHIFFVIPVNGSEPRPKLSDGVTEADGPTLATTSTTEQASCPYLPRTASSPGSVYPVRSTPSPGSAYPPRSTPSPGSVYPPRSTPSPGSAYPPRTTPSPGSAYPHYNNARGAAMGRLMANPFQTVTGISAGTTPYCPYRTIQYIPYQTMSGARVGAIHYGPSQSTVGNTMGGADPYNPYHTITGMVPSSYQRSEYGLQRVPTTSRREYGIGGSSLLNPQSSLFHPQSNLIHPQSKYGLGDIPPSLASVVLPSDPVSSPMLSKNSSGRCVGGRPVGMHRVSTLPAYPNLNHQPQAASCQQNSFPRLPSLSPEQATFQSINQLTVRSAGGLSVDVGSTDGRNVTVHGAVVSAEQLPFLPSVDRDGQDDAGSKRRGGKEMEPRQTWENKAQFILACVGYAVGLGNLWRFPYLCYKSGGGAGVGTVVISFLLCTYYNVIIAWVIFYLVQSFYAELPWSHCNTTWAVNCFDDYGPGIKAPNGTKSATEEFFDEVVLQKSEGINDMGSIRFEILLALFSAWMLVYFSLWKSVKSSGRVVYVTATLPYLLIGAFLWRALTLPGANKGLQYFFEPRWELLLQAQVWVNAAAQNFNSIGIAFGSMIALASYNKFNNNIVIDTWAISITNSMTSLMAGMIVFSTLGNIALEQGKEIDDVVAEGRSRDYQTVIK